MFFYFTALQSNLKAWIKSLKCVFTEFQFFCLIKFSFSNKESPHHAVPSPGPSSSSYCCCLLAVRSSHTGFCRSSPLLSSQLFSRLIYCVCQGHTDAHTQRKQRHHQHSFMLLHGSGQSMKHHPLILPHKHRWSNCWFTFHQYCSLHPDPLHFIWQSSGQVSPVHLVWFRLNE